MEPRKRSNVILAVIGTAVGVLVVAGVILALQPPTTYDPGTPEATAQDFYEAILDGDDELARTYMTEELKSDCNSEFWYVDRGDDVRIVITNSEIDGARAVLEVTIETSYGAGPFDSGIYGSDERLILERVSEGWLISEPSWPMRGLTCKEFDG